jgi:hypothetical protein
MDCIKLIILMIKETFSRLNAHFDAPYVFRDGCFSKFVRLTISLYTGNTISLGSDSPT